MQPVTDEGATSMTNLVFAPCMRTEAWPASHCGSWAKASPTIGGQAFGHGMSKAETFGPCYYGQTLVKMCRYGHQQQQQQQQQQPPQPPSAGSHSTASADRSGAAVIIATPAGHVSIGCPRAGATTNGEVMACTLLGLLSPDAARQAHGASAGHPHDAHLEERATQAARKAGFVPDGSCLKVVTAKQMRATDKEKLFNLSRALAERGFMANANGRIVYFLADEAHGRVVCQPRLLGSAPHGTEYNDPGRWGAYARIGVDGFATTTTTQKEWLEQLHSVRSKNAAKSRGGKADSKVHGTRSGPDGFAARNGAADSKVLGKRAGPDGFMAQIGAADSKVHGKRGGPDGWLARSKRGKVIATVKVMCTEGAPAYEQIVNLTQIQHRSKKNELSGSWHPPKESKIGRVQFSFSNCKAIPPVLKRTVRGQVLSFRVTEYKAIPLQASPEVGENPEVGEK